MADTREVFVYDVDMNKFDSAAILLGQERQDQGRVEVRGAPMGRPPRLNNQALRDNLQDRARKDIVEGVEGGARLSRNRDRRSCKGGVFDGIEIHVE